LSLHRQLLYWQRQRAATGVAAVLVVSLPFPTWRHTFICCGTGLLQVRADTAAITGAVAVTTM